MNDIDLVVWFALGGAGAVAVAFFVFLSVILLTAWRFMREGGEFFERENRRARLDALHDDEDTDL